MTLREVADARVLAYWHNRPLVASEAFAQIEAFLRRLRATHDMFSELLLMTKTGYARVEADLSNLEAELIEGINDTEWRYLNDDPNDFSFSLSSRSEFGFSVGFTDSSSERRQRWSLSVTCGQTLSSGSAVAPNSVIFIVSPEMDSPALLRTLLNEIVMFWRPEQAVVTRTTILELLDPPVGELKLGWLTYLADPEVARAVPSGFAHEPFADGVLIEAAEQPGRADDADYVHRLTRLRDALRPQGFLGKLGTLLTARS